MSSNGMADVLPSLSCADRALSSPSELEDHRTELQPARLLTQTATGDEILLTAAANGSKEALGILFHRYQRTVLNVAWRILKDRAEAEDLRQEVFLLIFQKAKSFDALKGTASSWIIQIAYHSALNRKKYLSFRQHYNVQALNEEQIEGDPPQPFVDEIFAKAILKRLREHLSTEQRSTLELFFFEGYSLREIAEKTGHTLGNVRHHYYRGLERLRSDVFPQKHT